MPYGQFVIGRLYYDVTNKEEDYACKPLTGINIVAESRVDRFPIVMVDRGSCTFVSKARNVQRIGGALALIIDNQDENIDKVQLNDDGTGSDIIIPTIMISKSDGEKIKDFFMKNKDDGQVLASIVVSIEFRIVNFKKNNNFYLNLLFIFRLKQIEYSIKYSFPQEIKRSTD